MHLTSTPLCSFCSEADEHISHLFYQCQKSIDLWSNLRAFFTPEITLPPLTLHSTYFGLPNCGQIETHLLLIFEIFLYKQREVKVLNFNHLINKIKLVRNIEFNLAFDNEKRRAKNRIKWAKINHKLQ
jgi:hypothetical protein